MKNNKNSDEPRDEFDHIAIPSFVTKPFEKLAGRPAPAPRSQPYDAAPDDRTPDTDEPVYGDSVYGDASYGHASYGDDENRPSEAPVKWWAGSRGKILAYAAGTLFLLFIQTRG
jgi:hypothetical protein